MESKTIMKLQYLSPATVGEVMGEVNRTEHDYIYHPYHLGVDSKGNIFIVCEEVPNISYFISSADPSFFVRDNYRHIIWCDEKWNPIDNIV
jgi:hypothetical protein